LLKRLDKKPIPSIQALRNIQRFLQTQNSKVGQVKLEDLIDDSIVRELDKSGYFERINAEYGVK
jgi:acetylglutamate synthase